MRPDQNGVPKVLLTITDGLSNVPSETKAKANILKKREFNLISVGIKDPENDPKVFLEELLVLSSTANDQYYLDDFNKIKGIINDITRKTCQQPAQMRSEDKISAKVEKNSYKYFKYSLNSTDVARNAIPGSVTINLKKLSGSSEVFGSFDEPNPKSDDSFVKDIPIPDKEENFYEDDILRMKRQVKSKRQPIHRGGQVSTKSDGSQSITVPNPNGSGTLYFSVLGKGENNQFNVSVFLKDPNSALANRFSVLLTLASLIASFLLSK